MFAVSHLCFFVPPLDLHPATSDLHIISVEITVHGDTKYIGHLTHLYHLSGLQNRQTILKVISKMRSVFLQ